MLTGILHTHTLVVVLFLLLYTIKVVLLLMNHPTLDQLRAKTKVADMILGTFILVTGSALMILLKNTEAYIITKLVLVVACIPAGIIAMKKSIKPLAVAVWLIFIYVLAMAYTDSVTLQSSKIEVPKTNAPADSSATSQVDGQAVYTAACSSCHGTEGNNGLADAKDLTTSKLSSEEIKNQIIQGKNVMPSFEGKLTNEEIDAVVKYTEGLRK